MHRHSVRDFRQAFTARDLLRMVPMDPGRLMLERLKTRDVWGDEYEVLEFLIASSDWHNRHGLHCHGAIPPIGDIAIGQDLPFERALTAFALLRNAGVVVIYPATNTHPNGSCWIALDRIAPITAATLEQRAARQIEGPTITSPWRDRAVGREGLT